jgi:CheY-like chemotaxis protein
LNKSILIVDDNDDFLDLLDLALSPRGYTIYTARSGEEGLDRFAECDSLDLILVDVQMPDMNGREFIDRLCERRSDVLDRTNIVYCTAGSKPKDDRVDGCLNKMTDLAEFLSSVRRLAESGAKGSVELHS